MGVFHVLLKPATGWGELESLILETGQHWYWGYWGYSRQHWYWGYWGYSRQNWYWGYSAIVIQKTVMTLKITVSYSRQHHLFSYNQKRGKVLFEIYFQKLCKLQTTLILSLITNTWGETRWAALEACVHINLSWSFQSRFFKTVFSSFFRGIVHSFYPILCLTCFLKLFLKEK